MPLQRVQACQTESAKEPPGGRSRKPTPGEFAIVDVLTGDI